MGILRMLGQYFVILLAVPIYATLFYFLPIGEAVGRWLSAWWLAITAMAVPIAIIVYMVAQFVIMFRFVAGPLLEHISELRPPRRA